MFLDKKTLFKICLYFALNSTIFRAAGTRNVLDSEHVDVANNKFKSGFSLYFILFHKLRQETTNQRDKQTRK